MIVYEEYATAKEKRQAQKGAKRAIPTGKARGYFFAFNENGRTRDGGFDGMGSTMDAPPGAGPNQTGGISSGGASFGFLREKCRRVGGKHLPPAWKKVWERLRETD